LTPLIFSLSIRFHFADAIFAVFATRHYAFQRPW
jgi:hypothetical protein